MCEVQKSQSFAQLHQKGSPTTSQTMHTLALLQPTALGCCFSHFQLFHWSCISAVLAEPRHLREIRVRVWRTFWINTNLTHQRSRSHFSSLQIPGGRMLADVSLLLATEQEFFTVLAFCSLVLMLACPPAYHSSSGLLQSPAVICS